MGDDAAIVIGGGGETARDAQKLLLRYGNRHGLITGATGTGKTVTLQVLAEGLSAAGVPCFAADVKGDLSGLAQPGDPGGTGHAALVRRAETIGVTLEYRAAPVVFWDLFGEQGHPVRATVADMGPLLLSRLMELSEAQEGVMNIAFRIADEQGLALLDLKDLRAMLAFIGENAAEIGRTYGTVAPQTVGAIQRQLLILENQGATGFLGEPALRLADMIATEGGRGRVNVLMADRLMQAPRLYAMFLLWLLSELFEQLPEVGDPERPVFVFFFDEAHLLFKGAPKALVEKVALVVRLIRSKGVGVWFVTQNPDDVPPEVLGQLGNRIQHALRAYTPREAKALRQAAGTFRPNPRFDTETAIREVGTGEAVTSLLEAKGVPGMVERTLIRPPASRMGPLDPAERRAAVAGSPVAGHYEQAVDSWSAHEILTERAEAAAREAQRAEVKTPAPQPGTGRRYEPQRPARAKASLGEELARTVVKQLGTREGQRLVRGVLGSLFRGR